VPFPLTALAKGAHKFDPSQPPPERLASAGRVTPFVELRLVKPDGTDAAPGELGEIWARTDTTMTGYWNRPDETHEVMRDDGWAATGDIGQAKDGYIHIVDRKKDMIVSGGFNIFPSEVENVISQLEGVEEVAVIGVPDPKWGETVMAVVARRKGYEVSEADIDEICRSQIASYKRPRAFAFVHELPKTGSGKIMRRELRDKYWAGRTRSVGE
jgi:acyl-CoA synthetase (AMP-forming)/AMP-acid ligase II